ncbi:hypothetical protein ACIB24_18455 [Spongisporangium articulatum]|uniref:Uncharacterized protein n=1 Tax=Spongisporangium articulatum TaxID=3362603 RepID=A0ABW8ARM1_9ACTN
MLDLPRSVRLAAWGTALLGGRCDVVSVGRAVVRDDEPHDVLVDDAVAAEFGLPAGGVPARLVDVLPMLPPGTEFRVVLPAPGDLLGLPGPAAFNEAALAAGESVLVGVGDGARFGLVPDVTEFGSVYEPGAMVTWHAVAVDNRPGGVAALLAMSVADADRELRSALNTAIAELARLDIARWREDAADRVAAIRDGGLEPGSLPDGTPGRCLRVLATAARVRAIVQLASEDDGAAVTGHEAVSRARTLRELDSVSRRAMVAAVNGILEPAD